MKHRPTLLAVTLGFPSGCLSCPLAFPNRGKSLTPASLLSSLPHTFAPKLVTFVGLFLLGDALI